MNIHAIIFDLDGVILESGNIKTQAFLELFAEYPQWHARILEHHLENLGISRYDKFEWIYRELLRKPLSPAERAHLGECFSQIVLAKILDCPFVPGALETLKTLADKCLLFIGSGTPQAELDLILERRGLDRYFVNCWGAPATKTAIVNLVLNEYALEPSHILFVGDGSSDYDAASEMGIHFLARDTSEQHALWVALGVQKIPDLKGFSQLVMPREFAAQ